MSKKEKDDVADKNVEKKDQLFEQKKKVILSFLPEIKSEFRYLPGAKVIEGGDIPYEEIDSLTEGLACIDGSFNENEYREALGMVKNQFLEILQKVIIELPKKVERQKNESEIMNLEKVYEEMIQFKEELLGNMNENPLIRIVCNKDSIIKSIDQYLNDIVRLKEDRDDFEKKGSFYFSRVNTSKNYFETLERFREKIENLQLECLRKKDDIDRILKNGGSYFSYYADDGDLVITFYNEDGTKDLQCYFCHVADKKEFSDQINSTTDRIVTLKTKDTQISLARREFIEEWKSKEAKQVISDDDSPWSLRRDN